VTIYNVLGRGFKEISGDVESLDRWSGEDANFWLSVITDLQNRAVQDVFILPWMVWVGFPMRAILCSPKPSYSDVLSPDPVFVEICLLAGQESFYRWLENHL